MTRALCALFALAAFCSALATDDEKRMTGVLLVARGSRLSRDFNESVVFVTNQSGNAPVGVVINKPTRTKVATLFPDIAKLTGLDDRIHFGGPSSPDTLSFYFRADKAPSHPAVMEILPHVYFSTNYDLLVELLHRDKPMTGLRIFRGFARWGSGQLEGEIARKNWVLVPASATAMFETRPERLWSELQGNTPRPSAGFGPRATRRGRVLWATGQGYDAAPQSIERSRPLRWTG